MPFDFIRNLLAAKKDLPHIHVPAFLESAFSGSFIYKDDNNNTCDFYVQDIGSLKITDGRIIACDPFVSQNPRPFSAKFPKGAFPVQLAIAKIESDERIGFARVKFSEEVPLTWTLAIWQGNDISKLKEDELFGYPVDSGTGSFMDTSGAKELMRFLNADYDNFEMLSDQAKKNYRHTREWLLWNYNNANVAIFSSGLGDGYYASYIGYDALGRICRLVSDFALL